RRGPGTLRTVSEPAGTPRNPPAAERVIVTFACPDQRGIVHRVSGLLAALGCNITESQQYGDPYTKRFFMRVAATAETTSSVLDDLRAGMTQLGLDLAMDWQVHD